MHQHKNGIGLSIAERLLASHEGINICLACRNKMKAETARIELLKSRPNAEIDIVIIDTGNMETVYKAASEIKHKYRRLDFLYLNAGIMPIAGVNFKTLIGNLFSSKCIRMFITGEGLLQQTDNFTPDGLQQVFATNVFGHFILVKELQDILAGADRSGQIIWTSSSNASKDMFSLEDIQHQNGSHPYSSSKHAVDLISVSLNEKLNKRGIYSHTTCPGLVLTNLTYGILPAWFWNLMIPIMWLMRLITATMNYDCYTGSEALVWLSHQQPEELDPQMKYCSRCSIFGKRYVVPVKLKIDPMTAKKTYDRLSQMERKYRQLHKSY